VKIQFEKLVSRRVAELIGEELKLAGVKTPLENFLRELILSSIALLVIVPFVLFLKFKVSLVLSAVGGIVVAAIPSILVYVLLEMKIEQRKNYVESILPDYLQITAANIRSGISIDKAIVVAARPEFKYFSDDVKEIEKELYGGMTLQAVLQDLAKRYRSTQLQHTVRMMIEGIQYGGGMTDLLNQIARDLRTQQTIQKEISGQLFLYTIFIAFAALIGAPVLYGLTSQMVKVTDTVWQGINASNPGGFPSIGISFLKPSPPKITSQMYHNFSLAAVLIITGFASFIVSAISSGSVLKGIRFLPLFLLIGVGIFFVTAAVIGAVFGTISGGMTAAPAAAP